jgi:hypothetical protein
METRGIASPKINYCRCSQVERTVQIDADHLRFQRPGEYCGLHPGAATYYQQPADRSASAFADQARKRFGLTIAECGFHPFEPGRENFRHQQIPS